MYLPLSCLRLVMILDMKFCSFTRPVSFVKSWIVFSSGFKLFSGGFIARVYERILRLVSRIYFSRRRLAALTMNCVV